MKHIQRKIHYHLNYCTNIHYRVYLMHRSNSGKLRTTRKYLPRKKWHFTFWQCSCFYIKRFRKVEQVFLPATPPELFVTKFQRCERALCWTGAEARGVGGAGRPPHAGSLAGLNTEVSALTIQPTRQLAKTKADKTFSKGGGGGFVFNFQNFLVTEVSLYGTVPAMSSILHTVDSHYIHLSCGICKFFKEHFESLIIRL